MTEPSTTSAPMRLVVWNCAGGLAGDKARCLASLRPDVVVVPEAPQDLQWPDDLERRLSGYEWSGQSPARGLGVLAFGDWSIRLAAEPARVPWVLPVDVSGPTPFNLLAVWTIDYPGWPSYAAQVSQAIEAYRSELTTGAVVLAGDLNASPQTSDPRRHLANVEALGALGMVSAYHAHHDLKPGEEATGTLFWRRKQDLPFHCDLAFVPATWAGALVSAEVGTFEEWVKPGISDHVPVVIDLALA